MNILSLEVENYKRVRAIRIDPKGNLVVIGGRNGQGKTSVLDAIMSALGGKTMEPAVPIRRGEKDGSVTIDLGEYIVRKSFTETGNSYLKVETKEGAQFKSPQALLDKLVGGLSFDPLKFAQMDAKPQMETVRQFVGVDLTQLDAKRAELYSERTAVNRTLKDLQGSYNLKPHHEDAPDSEISVAALMEELDAIKAKNKFNQGQRDDLEGRREDVKANQKALSELKVKIEDAKAKLAEMERQAERYEADIEIAIEKGKEFAAEVEQLQDEDDTPIRDQIKNADATNAKVRENRERAELGRKVDQTAAQAEALTRQIEEIDRQKAEQMAAAKFPIPGMSFDESGLILNGLPFEQASSAEKLRASVAMGLALNPKLKVLLVRDGSLLDEESLRLLSEMAEAAGAQVWLEMVGNPDQAQVIIEDGEIQGCHLKEAASQ